MMSEPNASTALRRRAPALVLAAASVAAVVVRWQFVSFESGDYRAFLLPWFTSLLNSGGLTGLATVSSNYNSPYLVLLALLTYLPIDPLVSIKVVSMVFDLLLALVVYKVVALVRPGSRWAPTIAAGVTLFVPTVLMNSSVWAQCDSLYASFGLGSLYLIMTRRPWRAFLLFGLAFAFKLQAVFLLPVLLGVVVVNRLHVRSLVAVPVTFAAALVPAWLAGRSWLTQLLVYPAQMNLTGSDGDPARTGTGGGRVGAGRGAGGGGGFGGPPDVSGQRLGGGSGGNVFAQGGGGTDPGTGHAFTYNAPTWYAWLPSDAGSVWKAVGLGVAALVVIAFTVLLLRRRRQLEPAEILLVAAASTLIIPLLLPEMHERYFYLAEVLTVAAVFVDIRFLLPAVAIQLASISTYLAYFASRVWLPLEAAAVIATVGMVAAGVILVLRLRPPRGAGRPAPAAVVGGA